MDIEYRLNCGQYVLHRDGLPVKAVTDTVAIVVDTSMECLVKHGTPADVSRWLESAKAKFIEKGFLELAESLVMLEGRFPIDDLNMCLTHSGYAMVLYRRITAGSTAMDALPSQPLI